MNEVRLDQAVAPTEVGLKAGDKGPAVGVLQRHLSEIGYLPINATVQERLEGTQNPRISEVFDEETQEALRAYQAFYGLPVSGRLDDISVGQMSLPRCGVPDIWNVEDLTFGISRFVLAGSRWDHTDFRYGFVNFTTGSARRRIRRAVRAAFRTWSAVAPITFTEMATPPPGGTEIEVRFATTYPHGSFDGPNGVLARAYPPPSPSGGVNAGDIYFDDAETWNTEAVPPTGEKDLQTVATHEIGHALGLKHSSERGAIMYRYYLGVHRTLHPDDIAGIGEVFTGRVPFVLERRPAYAATEVRLAGLKFRFHGIDGPNSYVAAQSPSAKTVVDIGSEVDLVLKNGPIP
jgi:peptidoglycan hydrolase-like protein with peptidoglycan-binding domain